MRSDFIIRRAGREAVGTGEKTAAMGPGSGNDRRVPRSVIIRVRQDIPGADSARIPGTIRPACLAISVHLSHPAPGWLVALNVGCSHGRQGAVFLGVAFSSPGSAEESESRLSGLKHFEQWF